MRTVLRNIDFRKLWFAQVALALGDAVMQMGLLELFRLHNYNEREETAKLLFAVALPGLLFGPVVMAYLDRWQRRSVLIVSDLLRMVIVIVIAVWLLPILSGNAEVRGLFTVYVMIFCIGVITTFYYPARYALMPNLVAKEKLIQANTLFTTSLAVAGVGGRAFGGFVAEKIGVEWAVLSNAVAYLIGVALVWNIRMQPHATTLDDRTKPPGGWAELKTGLLYLWRHPTAMSLAILAAVFAFLGGVFIVAIVGYAYETLGLRTGGLGYLFAAAGTGAAIGIALVGHGGAWTHANWLPFVQMVVAGLLVSALGMTHTIWLAVVVLVLLGAIGATVLIPIDAKLQAQVDDQRRGAVFAARGMMTSFTMLIAFWLQFGTEILKKTPSTTILLWLGIGTVGAAALTALTVKPRRS